MVNFIVCDNNKHIVTNVVNVINSTMMNNNLQYKIFPYLDYNEEFHKQVSAKKSNTIYILDIEVNGNSGIDIAREIRKIDDRSIIIFLSKYNNLVETILTDNLMSLTFISKQCNNYQEKLKQAICKALSIFDNRGHLKIIEKGVSYLIPLKDILYITHDSVERKSIIITEYNDFWVNKSLAELFETLPNTFKYSHRACIVNMDRITKVEIHKMLIYFDEGTILNLFSNTYKKEIKDYVINK